MKIPTKPESVVENVLPALTERLFFISLEMFPWAEEVQQKIEKKFVENTQ